jgi:hypothetical protein
VNSVEQSHALLEHTWRYFELHAGQRMAVFNFFLVVSGAAAAGLAATLQGSPRLALVGVALGLLLVLVAFVFWKLDQRVAFLIKHAEAALAEVERSLPEQSARLFLSEPQSTSTARRAAGWWVRQWTYGRAFRFVFWIMGLIGIAGAALSACKAAGLVSL